ncbi:unnamed protein product [Lymnaea stagnalis]|uniref:Uncharacterized protein n=1 Tax=Lymnaea stagnalis TaxID=6523 RepID=A0AAV2H2P7_LYMST
MEYTVIIFLCGLVLLCNRGHAYQGQDSGAAGLDDSDTPPLEGVSGELEESALRHFVQGVDAHGEGRPGDRENSARHNLADVAFKSRSLTNDEVADFLTDISERLRMKLFKRGWNRVNVQTRFAPFGTKLVPNRKLENNGATLLRYGRSN